MVGWSLGWAGLWCMMIAKLRGRWDHDGPGRALVWLGVTRCQNLCDDPYADPCQLTLVVTLAGNPHDDPCRPFALTPAAIPL